MHWTSTAAPSTERCQCSEIPDASVGPARAAGAVVHVYKYPRYPGSRALVDLASTSRIR